MSTLQRKDLQVEAAAIDLSMLQLRSFGGQSRRPQALLTPHQNRPLNQLLELFQVNHGDTLEGAAFFLHLR